MWSKQTDIFIDTPITSATVDSVEKLKAEGYRVIFRDHHGIDGNPSNGRERKVVSATERLQHLLAEDCYVTIRRLHPACSTLVSAGEFKDALAIIADPDADGLTAAMKAAGITYDGLDEDAAKLDGEPQLQVTGTPISQFLAKGIAAIPSYDSSKPKEREQEYQKLFSDWLKAVNGDSAAIGRLEKRVLIYDEAVKVSKELAKTAREIVPGVKFVDMAEKPLFDAGTLHGILESDPACSLTIFRKSLGPIAALHGIQYSLSVAKQHQRKFNLHLLLPSDLKSDPEAGVISNVSFLLHVSQDVYDREVLPRIKETNWN